MAAAPAQIDPARMTAGLVVVGGGVSGCAAAQRLHELGHPVTLLEAADHLGGRAHTMREGGFSAETGGDTVLSFYSGTRGLMERLGMVGALKSFNHASSLHDGERLHAIRAGSPLSYAGTPLLGVRDKVKLAAGYLRASNAPRANLFDGVDVAGMNGDGSLADWARAHFGENALKYLVRPAVESRWYFSCDELPASFGRELIRRAPLTRFYCVTDGMSSLLAKMIRGVEVMTSVRVGRVEAGAGGVRITGNGDRIDAAGAIIATDAPAAAELLPPSYSQVEALARSRYSRNVRVLFGYRHDAWADHSPASINPVIGNGYPIATVSLVSRKSSGLVPAGSEVVAVHLTGQASRQLSDGEAVSAAREAIVRFLPAAEQDPLFVRAVRWERALPIPQPEQLLSLARARESIHSRLALAGDYFSLPTIESAVRSGQRAADRLHTNLL